MKTAARLLSFKWTQMLLIGFTAFIYSSCSINQYYTYTDGIYEQSTVKPNTIFSDKMKQANGLSSIQLDTVHKNPLDLNNLNQTKRHQRSTYNNPDVNIYVNNNPYWRNGWWSNGWNNRWNDPFWGNTYRWHDFYWGVNFNNGFYSPYYYGYPNAFGYNNFWYPNNYYNPRIAQRQTYRRNSNAYRTQKSRNNTTYRSTNNAPSRYYNNNGTYANQSARKNAYAKQNNTYRTPANQAYKNNNVYTPAKKSSYTNSSETYQAPKKKSYNNQSNAPSRYYNNTTTNSGSKKSRGSYRRNSNSYRRR